MLAISFAIFISFMLVLGTALLHYEVLRGTSRLIPRLSIPLQTRILAVIVAAFVAHLLEVALYAFAFILMDNHLALGEVIGATEGRVLDFFYFSITTYTTLGVGDLSPSGPIRIVAGVEALNGLVLITWSASFTYLSMEKFWKEDI
jgi:hypothetical protein